MKLFESIESKWEHHCDAGMPELLNFLANEGDEVVTTTRKLSEEVNRRIPYKGVTIGAKQIQKNIDLLIENNYIQREIIGSGYNQRTVYKRGTGRGTAKKKEEIDWKAEMVKWYNKHLADFNIVLMKEDPTYMEQYKIKKRENPLLYTPWIDWTQNLHKRVDKCQRVAKSHNSTIGTVLQMIEKNPGILPSDKRSYHNIFFEDKFLELLNFAIYGNNRTNGARTAVGGARTAADISRQRSAEQLIALANQRAERGNK